MKWEEFSTKAPKEMVFEAKEQVNVECPKCGKKIWRRNDIVLATFPAQYRYECECGWWGSSFN